MKGLWKHKWVVIPLGAAVILAAGAVGAVALASPAADDSQQASVEVAAALPATSDAAAEQVAPAVEEVGNRKAKVQERLERIKKRLDDARSRMTPEDRAAFDRLQGKAKGQRETLRQAREDLAETQKQIRDLVKKYPPTTTTTAPPMS